MERGDGSRVPGTGALNAEMNAGTVRAFQVGAGHQPAPSKHLGPVVSYARGLRRITTSSFRQALSYDCPHATLNSVQTLACASSASAPTA
jgi:hypothetical protein